MGTITLPRNDIPAADRSGLLTGDWYRWARDITARAGGVSGAGTDDLSLSQFEDAGIEETKALVNAARDEAWQMPVAQQHAVAEDPSGEVAALRAEVAALRAEIEALKQGLYA